MNSKTKPTLLLILDGWGYNPGFKWNAIEQANTPNWDSLWSNNPHTVINAGGRFVGLPEGQMGNSEVGHLNLGAGRVIKQDLVHIDDMIADGSFYTFPPLISFFEHIKQTNTQLHLCGLVSDGGVHSHVVHLHALLDLAMKVGIAKVKVHAFLDGRDTPPQSAATWLKPVAEHVAKFEHGAIATIVGRYYIMDRDKRWERVELGYNAVVNGAAEIFEHDPMLALNNAYNRGERDELVKPIVMLDNNNQPLGRWEDNDSVLFWNFRADRVREFSHALLDSEFNHFQRRKIDNLQYFSFKTYDETPELADKPVLVHETVPVNIMIEWLGKHQIKVFKVAETEKYAHVTYFFNGGIEEPFANETRQLIPSPKVATYDLQPEMSAYLVLEKLVETLNSRDYGFVLCNFANPDMVGHTGVWEAGIAAAEHIDKCLAIILECCTANGYQILVTADHGNLDEMKFDNGEVSTQHSLKQVPVVLFNTKPVELKQEHSVAALCDVCPTLLQLMELPQPAEMTGSSLLK